MKTIEEITNGFLKLVEKFEKEAKGNDFGGYSKLEAVTSFNKAYQLFLEKPEKRVKNLSNKWARIESYLP